MLVIQTQSSLLKSSGLRNVCPPGKSGKNFNPSPKLLPFFASRWEAQEVRPLWSLVPGLLVLIPDFYPYLLPIFYFYIFPGPHFFFYFFNVWGHKISCKPPLPQFNFLIFSSQFQENLGFSSKVDLKREG